MAVKVQIKYICDMEHPLYFPFYCIYSDIVKSALGLKDSRSIEGFFVRAGVTVHIIGGKKCVMCDDLLNLTKPQPVIMRYEAQSDLSREIDRLFPD